MRWIPPLTRTQLRTATPAPLRVSEVGGLELSHLWPYVVVGLLLGASMLLSTWSRIDLVETAVDLDHANANLKREVAEHDRLELELATLQAPARLSAAAEELDLVYGVTVTDIAPLDDGGLIRKPTPEPAISQRSAGAPSNPMVDAR